MAFADPIANLTIATVAKTLPRVSTSGSKSVYRQSDGLLVETVSHQESKQKVRSMVRIDETILHTDEKLYTHSFYVVYERPSFASPITVTKAKDLFSGLSGQMTATSSAAIEKIYNRES
jgi:hypothetical protein